MRWLKRIGCGLLILLIPVTTVLILGICAWAWRHHRIQERLDAALAELDRTDPGWRLADIEVAREQIPEDENSARVIVAAARLLPKDWPPKEFGELFSHLPPEEQLAPDTFARLKQELDSLLPALKEARKLANMPRGRHHIIYQRNILNTLLKGADDTRRIVPLLLYDAMRYDQEHDPRQAMIACQAAFNAGRSLGEQPFVVSQLIRIKCIFSAYQGLERTLAQGQPPTEEMSAFQRLLADEDAFPVLFVGARGERAVQNELMDAIESGDISFSAVSDGRPEWNERLFGFLYRDNIRDEHPIMLAIMSRWVALARLPFPEQRAAEWTLEEEISHLPKKAILTRLMSPAIVKLGNVSRRNHGYLRCLNVALAAEQYRRKTQAWPDTIDQLCPKYLPVVPLDPFDGLPLRYRRLEDGITIYSIGQDEVDNGGDLDRDNPDQPGVDIGIRLWDVPKRRQPPRPKQPLLNPE